MHWVVAIGSSVITARYCIVGRLSKLSPVIGSNLTVIAIVAPDAKSVAILHTARCPLRSTATTVPNRRFRIQNRIVFIV